MNMSSNHSNTISKNTNNDRKLETNLEQLCNIYDSERFKYAVVCVNCCHFKKIKLKKYPSGYDRIYTHMVKQLSEAIKLSETKYNSSEFVVLADLHKTHMKQIDTKFIKNLIVILENTFPDRLKYCIIRNAPSIFKIIYKLIYPWVDKDTRHKFMFESKGKLKKILSADLK